MVSATLLSSRGSDPLYIAIATYQPTIWRFYGATERVERVVVISNGPQPDRASRNVVSLAGVVGLPAEQTSFPAGRRLPEIFLRNAFD